MNYKDSLIINNTRNGEKSRTRLSLYRELQSRKNFYK